MWVEENAYFIVLQYHFNDHLRLNDIQHYSTTSQPSIAHNSIIQTEIILWKEPLFAWISKQLYTLDMLEDPHVGAVNQK